MEADLLILTQFIKRHPVQAAHHLEALTDAEAAAFLDDVPLDLAVPLINSMSAYKAINCLALVKPALAAALLEKADPNTATSLLRQLDPAARDEWLSRLSADRSAILSQKLNYDAGSIGAVMLPLPVVLRYNMVVADAIRIVKDNTNELSTSVYVVDEQDQLVGQVRIHELFLASQTEQIASLMEREPPRFFADIYLESIKDHPGWYQHRTIPVVDSSERLIGVLNFEATRDHVKPGQDRIIHLQETSSALGELFRLGLTGFVQTLGEAE